ncbi:MAG TPA: hypothetical protein VGS10_23235 [Terracidiphilus sp.]|nr:hypothetical protein [Terracidiphilus sp.]
MIELESMAVAMPEVAGHPNRAEFRGVLTVVDVPSQRAPAGSGGKRVVLTRKAAEEALPSLLGMALDYAPSFDRHDVRRKVGVITSADMAGRNLEVGGYLYAKDFPEVVQEIGRLGRRTESKATNVAHQISAAGRQSLKRQTEGARLRASLAAAVAEIRSLMASGRTPLVLRAEANGGTGAGLGMSFEVTNADVVDRRASIWTLRKVTFTGAAILRKSKAAYEDTWIGLVES